jgi:TonB family protein
MAFKALGSVVVLTLCFHVAVATTGMLSTPNVSHVELRTRESIIWTIAFRDARSSALTSTILRSSCEQSASPEPIATPRPLFVRRQTPGKTVVSFIIGVDGHVHNPLIIEDSGEPRNSAVLSAVRSWRFRPAMCNGAPAEADGTVEFSRR